MSRIQLEEAFDFTNKTSSKLNKSSQESRFNLLSKLAEKKNILIKKTSLKKKKKKTATIAFIRFKLKSKYCNLTRKTSDTYYYKKFSICTVIYLTAQNFSGF